VKGEGNQQDYGMRIYDPRIGRFLSVDPIAKTYSELTPYQFASNNPIENTDLDGLEAADYRLSLKALNSNKNYLGLNVNEFRIAIKYNNPKLEQWQVNISAGWLLEDTYSKFSGFSKNRETMLSSVNISTMLYKGEWFRKIIPDFIQATQTINREGTIITFPYGGYYEVKATAGVITLQTSNKQLEAYFNKIPYARSVDEEHTAGDLKSGQLTLVVPLGTKIGEDVIKKATETGTNLYVTYPFLDRKTGKIVFSTPERLNNVSKEVPHPSVGNMDHPAQPDAKKASSMWKGTSSNSTEDQ